MKQGIKTILIVLCFLVLLFCLSGVLMMGSFSMNGTLEQQEHFLFFQKMYKIGIVLSVLFMGYLTFFVKVAK